MDWTTVGRGVIVVLLLVSAGGLTQSYVEAQMSTEPTFEDIGQQAATAHAQQTPVVGARERPTVISYQFGQLVAFAPNGTVMYYDNSTFRQAFDVDPVPGTRYTVLRVGNRELPSRECDGAANCVRNSVRRTNLSTGHSEVIYSAVVGKRGAVKWHDVDRVNETHLAVADIASDRVFFVRYRTGEITWQWNVSEAFDHASGGPYPKDWTHLNDLEVLDDGRVMVNLRNHDQVVFIRPGEGLQRRMTLGADDDHDVLYEQHNADYIPAEHGGPAVVVGDSENNRVVEYQWRGGSWERSWVWRDQEMQWPRDADRLPNGHTLLTDTQGQRVFEVDQDGAIVWAVSLPSAYDAERLGTGDESAGGPSAARAGLDSRGSWTRSVDSLKALLPNKFLNGMLFVAPAWVSPFDVVSLVGAGLGALFWGGLEAARAARRRRS